VHWLLGLMDAVRGAIEQGSLAALRRRVVEVWP
jgi:hypothetical protein